MSRWDIGYKQVPLKALEVGTVFDELISSHSCTMAQFKVLAKDNHSVTISKYGKRVIYTNEDQVFARIEMTDQEKAIKYKDKIAEVKAAMKNKLTNFNAEGNHEMWNAWIAVTPVEMAINCLKENIHIVGYFETMYPRGPYGEYNIGIVAQYNDGDEEMFWSHASDRWFAGKEWE
jgi:hypothetical protein